MHAACDRKRWSHFHVAEKVNKCLFSFGAMSVLGALLSLVITLIGALPHFHHSRSRGTFVVLRLFAPFFGICDYQSSLASWHAFFPDDHLEMFTEAHRGKIRIRKKASLFNLFLLPAQNAGISLSSQHCS